MGAMIVLFTDFGLEGPYIGQMQAVLWREAPGIPVVNLCADVPCHEPRAAAYLLAAYAGEFPEGSVFLGVVDPGVGGERAAVVVRADGRWYVGPDNGLFNVVAMRAGDVEWWDITWRPARLSASFHGRDLFAPVAARIARGDPPPGDPGAVVERIDRGWSQDHPHIIYIDRFGNAVSGVRAAAVPRERTIRIRGHELPFARTFGEVAPGEAFWYENANGLLECAVNRGRADRVLGLSLGDALSW